jgi:hypothetical protein
LISVGLPSSCQYFMHLTSHDLASSYKSLSVDYAEAYTSANRSILRFLTKTSRFAAMEVESTINGVYQPGRSSSPKVEVHM